jgi:glucan 1,3-beta-glucosidase
VQTVSASGERVLAGSVAHDKAWVWGNAYVPGGPSTGAHQRGTVYSTVRSSALIDATGSYHRGPPPTYKEYDLSQFVNVKSVDGLAVAGDGVTDDTANLQEIINQNAGCRVLFFPAGTYLVTDTLFFPPGSRVFGEVWSAISAAGSRFGDPAAPVPMVKVGNPGDVGVAQFSDMLFTVADILPGCTLLEVNMAGANPGDVGFWNTHFRVGGAAGSSVQTRCNVTPGECKAAFMLAHLTASSSTYIDNMWGWTADHDLDSGNDQNIAVGRGMLIEATKATWLVGLAIGKLRYDANGTSSLLTLFSEHNVLYQVNIYRAQNVFIGFQQSETPYWQGSGAPSLAPEPWSPLFLPSDPDFSWCSGGDAQVSTSPPQPSPLFSPAFHRIFN